jgi:hypothetical protein
VSTAGRGLSAGPRPDGSIHGMLVTRMALAAVAASVLVGALAVFAEHRSIGEIAVDRAAVGATALMALPDETRDPS